MGRCGVTVIKGLRVAYLSGIDFDLIGGDIIKTDPRYIGNYVTQEDIAKVMNDYKAIVEKDASKREGIDILIGGQWPLLIDEGYL